MTRGIVPTVTGQVKAGDIPRVKGESPHMLGKVAVSTRDGITPECLSAIPAKQLRVGI
jgi:hypothetical protein